MKIKSFTILLATSVILSSLALAGCSTTTSKSGEVITLEQNYKTETTPQWSKSSISALQKDGWEIQDNQKVALTEDKVSIPGSFYASKDNCVIEYNVFYSTLENAQAGESYLTRDKAYLTPKSVQAKDIKETTINANIENSIDKLELLKLQYSYPNMVTKATVEPGVDMSQYSESNPPPAPVMSEDGTVYETFIARTMANEVANPYVVLNKKMDTTTPENGMAGRTGSPTLEFSYRCINKPLNDKLLSQLITDMTINTNALPVVKN